MYTLRAFLRDILLPWVHPSILGLLYGKEGLQSPIQQFVPVLTYSLSSLILPMELFGQLRTQKGAFRCKQQWLFPYMNKCCITRKCILSVNLSNTGANKKYLEINFSYALTAILCFLNKYSIFFLILVLSDWKQKTVKAKKASCFKV